jgi:LmbE family N-acetylglucosaminyl deacetylase
MNLLRTWCKVTVLVTVFGSATFVGTADSPAVAPLSIPIGPHTRLVVVAPHPDDEALAAAGLIQRVRAAGGWVRVVVMTSGDGFSEGVEAAMHVRRPRAVDYRTYGSVRERETIAAMGQLGLDRGHLEFLGFPDGGLCLIAARDATAGSGAVASPTTGRVSPPSSEQVIRGAAYRGRDLRHELEAILVASQPTVVAIPAQDDRHPDHCATAIFANEAMDAVTREHRLARPRLLQYLVHADRWPAVDEPPDSPLSSPATAGTPERNWRTLLLTPEEKAAKRRALDAYATQTLMMGSLFRAFARPNELFLEGRGTAPSKCWCDDTTVASGPPETDRQPPPPR